jgi:hypothetical protein
MGILWGKIFPKDIWATTIHVGISLLFRIHVHELTTKSKKLVAVFHRARVQAYKGMKKWLIQVRLTSVTLEG